MTFNYITNPFQKIKLKNYLLIILILIIIMMFDRTLDFRWICKDISGNNNDGRLVTYNKQHGFRLQMVDYFFQRKILVIFES